MRFGPPKEPFSFAIRKALLHAVALFFISSFFGGSILAQTTTAPDEEPTIDTEEAADSQGDAEEKATSADEEPDNQQTQAQGPDTQNEQSENARSKTVPPSLKFSPPVPYPDEELEGRQEGQVILKLLLDEEGNVQEVEIHQALSGRFDQIALEIGKKLKFSPAIIAGEPQAVKILFAVDFIPPPLEVEAPTPEATPTTEGKIRGKVVLETSEGEENPPLAGVRLRLFNGETLLAETSTETAGRFEFTVAKGKFLLEAEAVGFGFISTELEVESNSPLPIVIKLQADADTVEIIVAGQSRAEVLRNSAEAVQVIELEQVQKQSVDLGEVLARQSGIGLRRGGGLGAPTRFSLNGFTSDQIRFFVDGVPLRFSGYPFGIANIPTGLIQHVEVYRGVVPIRFGADALGGAVNLATDNHIEGTHGSLSWQAGSFSTQRVAGQARHLNQKTGLLMRGAFFLDYAKNDYPIEVEVADQVGRISTQEVRRFHDRYRAAGGQLEVGVVDKSWADRLFVKGFISAYDQQVQNNIVMTVPYGEVIFDRLSTGATIRYEHHLGDSFFFDLVGGYSLEKTDLLDTSDCIYNWFGECGEIKRVSPGELGDMPRDQTIWSHGSFMRAHGRWQAFEQHAFNVSVAPSYELRTGVERIGLPDEARDPLEAERRLFSLVNGVDWESHFFDERLENIGFLKFYFQRAESEEPLGGDLWEERNRSTDRWGAGDSLRYRWNDWLLSKASYEYATRLPRPEEVFGDGVLINDNLSLRPEESHNANLSSQVAYDSEGSGIYQAEVNGFYRGADQLIVLLGNDRYLTYQNVFTARALGLESSLGWTSPREYVSLNGNVTWQDFRNRSKEGTFTPFAGDRVPNRPWLFANGSLALKWPEFTSPSDELLFTWNSRYVHEFYRSWESAGLTQFKDVIPSQLIHSVGLLYSNYGETLNLYLSVDAQNITDELAFDFFGIQKPGRAFYFKISTEI